MASTCWTRSMERGATVNFVVNGSSRRCPSLPSTPSGPPGTDTEIVAPGGSGAEASKASVSAEVCTQEPGTGGSRVGMGVSAARATVKVTPTLASDGTFVASGAGMLVTTERRPGDAVGVAAAVEGRTRVATRAVEAAAERAQRDDDRGDHPEMPGVALPASMCGFRHGMRSNAIVPVAKGSQRSTGRISSLFGLSLTWAAPVALSMR